MRFLSYVAGSGSPVFSPVKGYKWRLYYLSGWLYTSATAGTRSLGVYLNRGGLVMSSPLDSGEYLADTGSQTGVSSTYAAFWALNPAIRQPNVGSPVLTQGTEPLVVSAVDQIDIVATLISGDTITVTLVVDEVMDD